MTMTRTDAAIDVERIRSAFPALAGPMAFMENAGGSQVPRVVADAIRDFMLREYVQLGAPYELSSQATQTVADAHEFINRFMNGEDRGTVILGPSCTSLSMMLADCYARALPGDAEIIVMESGHEANVGPWDRLADRGFTVKIWTCDPQTGQSHLDDLKALLSEKTAIVACVHVSNLLGDIEDVPAITALAHEVGARVVVDGVAYAPHRAIDVAAWDVDWYIYSTYKVYGPHMAALFGKHDAIDELTGPHHFFIPKQEIPYKFEANGVSYEGCAGLLALQDYLRFVIGDTGAGPIDRSGIEGAFDILTNLEMQTQGRLVAYLQSRNDIRIIGPTHAEESRVSTISFVHTSKSSREIAESVCRHGIGIRHGHMYAYRLCERLGLAAGDGVVRVSLVHYNSPGEVDRLIAALDDTLDSDRSDVQESR
ncbi:MAG: aminotransferase class V-fold PLP-dependent enzyme [Planctomycetes bacterium]|nr:aminotransferase class V-fold PLP-dependent enzyme [Planctomycetota bacterium]